MASTTAMFGFSTITDTDQYVFDAQINGIVQSIEDHIPHRFVASISALNALTGALYPSGQIAVLTAADGGFNAGCQFVRAGNAWFFTSGNLSSVSTAVASLTANVKTNAGASFYDQNTATSRIFTNSSGNSEVLLGGSTWTNISYGSGLGSPGFGYAPGYRLVPGGVMLRGTIARNDKKAFATGATLLTVPAGARPSQVVYHAAVGTGTAVGNLQCGSDGKVILKNPAVRTSSWYSLDGFFIAQN